MPNSIMDGFFKKINQKINLRWCPDITILKDRFLKNLSNKIYPQSIILISMYSERNIFISGLIAPICQFVFFFFFFFDLLFQCAFCKLLFFFLSHCFNMPFYPFSQGMSLSQTKSFDAFGFNTLLTQDFWFKSGNHNSLCITKEEKQTAEMRNGCQMSTENPGEFFDKKVLIFFLFVHENIYCGYSLELPQWGNSNDYPQYMFSWRFFNQDIPHTHSFEGPKLQIVAQNILSNTYNEVNPCPAEPRYTLPLQTVQIQISWQLIWICTVCH